jgi:1-deoxy-D-xylulose-5-phosphate synthase
MRIFPNMVVMAPGDERDVAPMLHFALEHDGPISLRYPKAAPASVERELVPVTLGQAEIYEWGTDGCIVAFGSLFGEAVKAAAALREFGYDIGVINARFAKPLDTATILKAVREQPFVITVEEGCLQGGFGAAVLEAVNDAGLSGKTIVRCGIPDRWIMHAERSEQLEECGLDAQSLVRLARKLCDRFGVQASRPSVELAQRYCG